MFISNLYRNSELQDVVEIMVLNPRDEHFLKRNGIQVDMEDKTFDIALTARNATGKTVEISKGTSTIKEAFARLVSVCSQKLVTVH